MDLEQLHDRLIAIGVDVPQNTLRRWGYDKRGIIPRPERYTHGPGSKKSGPAASWSEQAVYEAAAVYAVLHSSRTIGHPPLSIIPHIKSAARQPYESPMAGYRFSLQAAADAHAVITVNFGYDKSLGPEPAGWQEVLATWIAAIEKAKRGIRIDTPQQVRFHWRSVKKDDGDDGVDYVPDNVNGDHVSLHASESGQDEIVIMIDGVDFRTEFLRRTVEYIP